MSPDESVPQILARWPSAPAGKCDICIDPIVINESHRVPNAEFRKYAERGYNPFARGRGGAKLDPNRHRPLGLSDDEIYSDWMQMVASDRTDWGLCPVCAEDLALFASSNELSADESMRGAAVIRALEEWMDQAPPGDAEWLVRELDDRASDWGDWGTALKSVVIAVLERCVQRDLAEDSDVEFDCAAANNRLGDFQVNPPPYSAAASAREKEMWASGLVFRAGLGFHTIVKITSDRYALLTHGGGIQDLAGKGKEW